MTSVADRMTLNDGQRAAVAASGRGPLRVVAGPGTGKTTTVVAMYVHLVEEAGLRPGEVLLLTFANNAAEQLRSRIDRHLHGSYDESWVSTFHSFATRVLTRWGPLHGVAPFTLMNGFQEKLLMRRVLAGMDAADLGGLAPLRHSDALVQDALWFAGILKQNLVRSDALLEQVVSSRRSRLVDLAHVYRAYWLEQERHRLWDFRDVVAQCHELLVANPALRDELSSKFRHVLVDEYQDVDSAQVSLLTQLVSAHRPAPRLAVVGDPNQSIYGFRGTQPAHIAERWPFGGETVTLTESYRSYAQILTAAGELLARWDAPPPALVSARGAAPVDVVAVDHERTAADEAASVARQVRELLDSGLYAAGEIAVILRSVRGDGRRLEEALSAAGVPLAVSGAPGLGSSDAVRFCVSALRALADPSSDEHLVDVLDSPFVAVPVADSRRLLEEAARRRGAGGDELRTRSLLAVLTHTCFLLADADERRWPLPWAGGEAAPPADESPDQLARQEAAGNAVANDEAPASAAPRTPGRFFAELSEAGRDAVHRFTWRWTRLVGLATRLAPHALLGRLVDDLGVLATALALDDGTRRQHVAGPLRLVTQALTDLDTLTARLDGRPAPLPDVVALLEQLLPEYADELDPPDDAEPGVRLLTVHAAKGLEFPVVFLAALASQRFPVVARARTPLLDAADQAWMDASLAGFTAPWPSDPAAFLAEEARLGYVAATRARDILRLSWADEYERGEPATASAFVEPLTAAGAQRRTNLELHRVPPGTDAPGEVTQSEAAAVAAWQPWSQPITFPPGSTDSASSVGRYLSCPRKYLYGKALRLPTDTGQAARRGSAFHAVMQRFHDPGCEARWRPALPDLAVAQQLFSEIADEELETYLAGVAGLVRRNAERKALNRLLTNYFEHESARWKAAETLGTEVSFQWTPFDDVTLVGYIDRVLRYTEGGLVEIADFKTGRSKTGGQVRSMLGLAGDPPSDFQLLIYLGAARDGAVPGVDPERVEVAGLWFPRDVFSQPPGIAKVRVLCSEEAAAHLPNDTRRDRRLVLDGASGIGRDDRLGGTLRELREGRFAPEPRQLSYTCLAQWGAGCEFQWVCPGRITEPSEFVPE